MKKPALNIWLPVVALLLLHLFIRTHHITGLEPYVDEGSHSVRAAAAWQFEVHPAREAHGKLLTYFWLGLFAGPPATALVVGRLSIALFSTLTAATIYLLGRWWQNHLTGLLALLIYALLPFAFFFERMALADPFAAGFAVLVVWRSLIFARRPTLGQGLVLGLLLALASLAKLTMALLPIFVVIATLLHVDWRQGIRMYIRTYLPGLMIAAFVVISFWLPVLIPAYIAQQAGDPFILINDFNIQRSDAFAPPGPIAYLRDVLPLLAEFTTPLFLLISGAIIPTLWIASKSHERRRLLLLVVWILVIAAPIILTARVVTARYLMPIAAPLTLLLALALGRFWTMHRLAPLAVMGILAGWLLTFALPFAATAPDDLNFSGNNAFDFQSGFFLADEAVREGANILGQQPELPIYATKEACHLLYFYSDGLDLRCLPEDPVPGFGQRLLDELRPGDPAYLVISWYHGPFHTGLDWLRAEEILLNNQPRFQNPGFEFRVWKIWIEQP